MLAEKEIYQNYTKQNINHFLTGEELSQQELLALLSLTAELKQKRQQEILSSALAGKHLALLFSKPSLRTRFSFTVAMRELGGDVVESIMATRKAEEPEDQMRVIEGYCHAMMVRTHADENLLRMRDIAKIPVINGLSDLHHPCQALADIFTLQEIFKNLTGLKLAYVGDGNNVLHSLLLLAPMLGVQVYYYCPPSRQPDLVIIENAKKRAQQFGGAIVKASSMQEVAQKAQAIYTDVWISMGFENQVATDVFAGFQVNEQVMKMADSKAVFMHCLPMERGQEVSVTLPDLPCSVIFQQSENRLHVQKALLLELLK